MKKILALAVVAALVFGTLTGCAKKKTGADNSFEELKKRGVFILGLDDSFPPMGFRDEKNEIVGFDIDLAKEVAKRMGVEFKAQPIDWDAKENELRGGKIDCIWNGLTITAERQEAFSISKPYLENKQVLVIKNDAPYTNLSDFVGKTIALQNGSSAEDAVNDSPDFRISLKEIIPLQDNLMALNDLQIGRTDGVVMDSIVADYVITQSGMPLKIMDEYLATEKYGIAFRKEDKKLADGVQKILEEMAKDGTVDRISEKWFGSNITSIGK